MTEKMEVYSGVVVTFLMTWGYLTPMNCYLR
jgi:hypothetical protein